MLPCWDLNELPLRTSLKGLHAISRPFVRVALRVLFF